MPRVTQQELHEHAEELCRDLRRAVLCALTAYEHGTPVDVQKLRRQFLIREIEELEAGIRSIVAMRLVREEELKTAKVDRTQAR